MSNHLIGINRLYAKFLFTESATFAELGPVEHTSCVSARLTFDNSLGQKKCVKITEQLQRGLE